MLTGQAILRINSTVSLTMDASWSLTSNSPVTVAQGGDGPIDIIVGRGETHQIQCTFWCQLNGFEYDFRRLTREKFDIEFIAGEVTFGGQRFRYGPCLMSTRNLSVDNAGGQVKIACTIVAAREKR
jgi:hypothetical protein